MNLICRVVSYPSALLLKAERNQIFHLELQGFCYGNLGDARRSVASQMKCKILIQTASLLRH